MEPRKGCRICMRALPPRAPNPRDYFCRRASPPSGANLQILQPTSSSVEPCGIDTSIPAQSSGPSHSNPDISHDLLYSGRTYFEKKDFWRGEKMRGVTTGVVTPSCTVTGGGTPLPSCMVGIPAIVGQPGLLTVPLPVITTSQTPTGTYTISVTAKDANGVAPSNGAQSLTLVVTKPSYTLAARLAPTSVNPGGVAVSAITVTPSNNYTGCNGSGSFPLMLSRDFPSGFSDSVRL